MWAMWRQGVARSAGAGAGAGLRRLCGRPSRRGKRRRVAPTALHALRAHQARHQSGQPAAQRVAVAGDPEVGIGQDINTRLGVVAHQWLHGSAPSVEACGDLVQSLSLCDDAHLAVRMMGYVRSQNGVLDVETAQAAVHSCLRRGLVAQAEDLLIDANARLGFAPTAAFLAPVLEHLLAVEQFEACVKVCDAHPALHLAAYRDKALLGQRQRGVVARLSAARGDVAENPLGLAAFLLTPAATRADVLAADPSSTPALLSWCARHKDFDAALQLVRQLRASDLPVSARPPEFRTAYFSALIKIRTAASGSLKVPLLPEVLRQIEDLDFVDSFYARLYRPDIGTYRALLWYSVRHTGDPDVRQLCADMLRTLCQEREPHFWHIFSWLQSRRVGDDEAFLIGRRFVVSMCELQKAGGFPHTPPWEGLMHNLLAFVLHMHQSNQASTRAQARHRLRKLLVFLDRCDVPVTPDVYDHLIETLAAINAPEEAFAAWNLMKLQGRKRTRRTYEALFAAGHSGRVSADESISYARLLCTTGWKSFVKDVPRAKTMASPQLLGHGLHAASEAGIYGFANSMWRLVRERGFEHSDRHLQHLILAHGGALSLEPLRELTRMLLDRECGAVRTKAHSVDFARAVQGCVGNYVAQKLNAASKTSPGSADALRDFFSLVTSSSEPVLLPENADAALALVREGEVLLSLLEEDERAPCLLPLIAACADIHSTAAAAQLRAYLSEAGQYAPLPTLKALAASLPKNRTSAYTALSRERLSAALSDTPRAPAPAPTPTAPAPTRRPPALTVTD